MVKGSWIKPGAVVIDCGINSIPGRISLPVFLPLRLHNINFFSKDVCVPSVPLNALYLIFYLDQDSQFLLKLCFKIEKCGRHLEVKLHKLTFIIVHFTNLMFLYKSTADVWRIETESVTAVAGPCGLPKLVSCLILPYVQIGLFLMN